MSITVNLSEAVETITATIVDGEETITATINELPRGVAGPTGATGATGPTGAAGPNSVTIATASDGTAELTVASLSSSGSILCTGIEGSIEATGANAVIGVTGVGSAIIASGSGSYIETSGTYRIINSGAVATLSATLTSNRDISFPDRTGTLAMGSGTNGAIVSADVTDASSGATDESVVNVVAKFGDNGELSAATFYGNSLNVQPGGSIILTSTNSGGLIVLTGESATSARSIAFPDASGTLALTTSNVATATALQTARAINGVSFNGTADITVAAAAGTLTGTTLAANVVTSSLTSVGTLSSLTVTNNIQSNSGNVSAAAAGSLGLLGRSRIYSSSDGTFQFRNNANSSDASLTASSITLSSSAVTPAINGGTAANDDLTLQGTTNATRTTSYVLIQPNGGLTQIGAGTPVTDTALPLQLSTGSSGTETNIGINKNGAYGFLLGFKNGTGTSFANYLGGYMRNVTTDPFSIIVNNTQIATTWTSNGSVGLGGTITHTGTLAGAHLIIDGTTGRSTFNGPAKLRGYTFATLPTGSIGDKAYITDGAASPTFRANAAGGGSTVTEVFFNGTAWINS